MKNTFKKVLFSLWAIGLVWAGTYWIVNAQWQWFWTQNPEWTVGEIWVIWDWSDWTGSTALITTIKTFVNRILWMLSLIALVICLWGWFQMLTASWDENKYKKWFTILKQAGLWLAVVWLSRLFVSLIFWLINHNARATA